MILCYDTIFFEPIWGAPKRVKKAQPFWLSDQDSTKRLFEEMVQLFFYVLPMANRL